MDRKERLVTLINRYCQLGIDQQIDYDKFYLYSIITHSTAIEGSTITEIENQLLFDQGISAAGKTIMEQMMNLDLKKAYEKSMQLAASHCAITVDLLREFSSILMKNTGSEYNTALGSFSSARGDLRLLNVTAGIGGKSYMNYAKVPDRLKSFCEDLNSLRTSCNTTDMAALYDMSFDAHYNLVTIHPWADGNGRMARLLMNHLQFEFGLIPTKVRKEDKEGYIKALVETRENDDLQIFRDFMTEMMIANLEHEINVFMQSIGEKEGENIAKRGEKKIKSREKIISALERNGRHTTKTLAELLGISTKAIEKQLAKLKDDGTIVRVGPDKGGHWEVVRNRTKVNDDTSSMSVKHNGLSGFLSRVNKALKEYDPSINRALRYSAEDDGFSLHYDDADKTVRRVDFDLERKVMNIYGTKNPKEVVGIFDIDKCQMKDLRKTVGKVAKPDF